MEEEQLRLLLAKVIKNHRNPQKSLYGRLFHIEKNRISF